MKQVNDMFNWLKKFWNGSTTPAPEVTTSTVQASAKEYLNSLRTDELSLGAAYRRGETVASAPAASSNASVPQSRPKGLPYPDQTAAVVNSDRAAKDRDDFVDSALIGAATGSAPVGYLVGGSLLGGIVGAAAFDSTSSSPTMSDCPGSSTSDGTP